MNTMSYSLCSSFSDTGTVLLLNVRSVCQLSTLEVFIRVELSLMKTRIQGAGMSILSVSQRQRMKGVLWIKRNQKTDSCLVSATCTRKKKGSDGLLPAPWVSDQKSLCA